MPKILSKSFLNSIPTVKDTVSTEVFDNINQNIRISLPAIVLDVSKYPSTQCLDVQPLIGTTYADGDTSNSPKIKNVFVKMAAAGTFKETYPIKEGDLVTLHWTHKDLNEYLNSGSKDTYTLPDHDDKWSMNDTYAMVGFGTRNDNQSPDPDNYRFSTEEGSYQAVITPEGDITEDSNNKQENNKTSVQVSSDSSTVTTGTLEENSDLHNITTQMFNVTAPQTNINGLVNITGVTSAPVFRGIIQGIGGGNAVSDKEFSATKLHAQDGASGTVTSQDGKTLVFVDGICVAIA